MNSIIVACSEYEQQGTRALERYCEDVTPSDALFDDLIDAVIADETSVPATWLLRAILEAHEGDGVELSSKHVARLCRGLERIERSDARLHVCQTVSLLSVPARNAEQMARFLRACSESDHKFVRAWAIDALQRLARQHARYRSEAAMALNAALEDPAASVRARARRIAAERH